MRVRVVRAGTGLYRVAALLAAVLGFALAPALQPHLQAALDSAAQILPAPLAQARTAGGPGIREWGEWLLARAAAAAWPAIKPVNPPAPAASGSQPPGGSWTLQEPPEESGALFKVQDAPHEPQRPSPVRPSARPVWVAVYHTHASEMYRTPAFAPEDPEAYHRFGTTDTGIIRVGAQLVAALNEYGIPAVHVTALHDTPDYRVAYSRSLKAAQQLVAQYPSLRLLIDLHRDAPQEGGELVTSVDGEQVAQIAIVVGTGTGGREGASNLEAARLLAAELDHRFPGLLRRVMVYPGRRYNQHLHPGALLIEVGSYRTREEAAMRSARLLAQAIAAMLLRTAFPRSTWG